MMFPFKKRRKEAAAVPEPVAPPVIFPDVCIFLVERRMGAARRGFLTSLAQRKGFRVMHEYSGVVTHVVSEQNSFADILGWIERKTGRPMQSAEDQESPHILDISWFTDSMSAGKPVPVEARHRLGILGSPVSKDKEALLTVSSYACQRRTPLTHHNAEITEILEDGVCHEVEALKVSEQYQCMELLTSIFGVGVRTAERWYKDGVRKLSDLADPNMKLSADQRAGIEHYTDLKQPVTLQEAERMEHLIKDALHRFVPDLKITMTGGFRRGKQQGHDVDFLITHPSEEALSGLLQKAVAWMDSQGLLLYHHTKTRSHVHAHRRSTHMDGHETCYAIFALPSLDSSKCEAEAGVPGARTTRRAVRVDLVVTLYDEYPFALLGWTGSKHFERELRRYSWHEKNLTLNSHGLYDAEKNCSLPATSEEEIFALLGLQYVPPTYRNA
ncbi:DNA-directed DNA/RNA polymerase mu isoform X2 [Dendropsophus ebraccatus]|uniref:DNA-directed DNA/RNA polymerase mu isoform X2 n=1 Tax=Dendropsophus ebraccatus TaxID=150705 RepID=UPI003831F9C5